MTGVNIYHSGPLLLIEDTTKPFNYIRMGLGDADTVAFSDPLPTIPAFQ
jgi:hypothetical protein